MKAVFADQGNNSVAAKAGFDMSGDVEIVDGNWGATPSMEQPLSPKTSVESSPVAQKNSRYVDIGTVLPSGMGFYGDIAAVAVRPMGPLEASKMHRAVAEQSIRHQVDAISATLDVSAYHLTLGDFQYLMYWSRMNSFKKHPVRLEFSCTFPDHASKVRRFNELKAKVEKGEELTEEDQKNLGVPPETLNQVATIQASTLKEKHLDFEACNEYMRKFYEEYGLYLWTPLVADLVEGLENTEMTADENYWGRYAGLLNPLRHGKTLKQRIDFLMGYMQEVDSVDIMSDFEHWADLCTHGVEEMVEVTCAVCGDKSKQQLRIDPMSFMPHSLNK